MIKKIQFQYLFSQSVFLSAFLGMMIGYVITEIISYFADTDVFKKGLFWKMWLEK